MAIKMELKEPFVQNNTSATLSDTLKDEIVKRFWPATRSELPDGHCPQFNAYFCYFDFNCSNSPDENLGIRSYGEILDLVDHLREHLDIPLKDLLPPTMPRSTESERAQGYNSIYFCVRLWLLIDVRVSDINKRGLLSNHAWRKGESLRQALKVFFPKQKSPSDQKPRLPSILQASNLQEIGGFNIRWIDDLREHLSFYDDEHIKNRRPAELRIFHHMTILQRMNSLNSRVPFPPGFLDETLDTAAVLLRQYNLEGKEWFKKQVKQVEKELGHANNIDEAVASQLLSGNALSAARYKHWGNSLSYLMSAFDEKEPEGIKEWWYDRRHGASRVNFMLTFYGVLLAIFFGFASTVIGAWQVALVYYPPK